MNWEPAALTGLALSLVPDGVCDVMVDRVGDRVIGLYELTCGHVGAIDIPAASITSVAATYEAVKAAIVPRPCMCLHKVTT